MHPMMEIGFPHLKAVKLFGQIGSKISSWFTDEKPISQLVINCSSESGINVHQSTDKSFYATIQFGENAEITCGIDDSGQAQESEPGT